VNSDEDLCAMMAGYLAGEIEAFDALYAALAARLRGYFVSLCHDAAVADDLLQETFMRLHRSRRTYQPGRPVLPWVFAIARHVFLMHRRATARRLRAHGELAEELQRANAASAAPAVPADRDELRRALRGVPPAQRQALLMHHVGDHSFAEIAEQLDLRPNAAKTRAFRGIQRMRELLKG
jgi:RNA polymerase sigma-70 factor, ECF subfamily